MLMALGMKASIVAYEDGDPENKRGPINSTVFQICWERCGKPRDLWDLQHMHAGAPRPNEVKSRNIYPRDAKL